MSSEIHLHHLWYKISAVEFGFYQPQQIRNASVKEITNPIAFDTNKNPNVNGLYDPCMGVSPNDRTAICVTCGHAGLQCSGHIAHIQLLLPVYNPLVIDRLLQLLKLKCFDCHRLRMRETVIEQYTMVFLLIKKGLLKQAIQYRQLKNKKAQRNLQKLSKLEKSQKTPSDRFQQKLLKKALESMKLTKYKIQKAAQYILKKDEVHTNAANALFNQILKEFYQQSNQKCPHCLKNYKGIKKQGASKIFLIKSNKKQKQTRKKSSSTTKGESMVQSAEETNEQKKQKKKQLYINPRQIYYQLKQLWRKQHKLLELIFGNGQTMNSFNMFFLYTIIVPPNRFRPESKLGQQKYLHDHTIILTKIIKINNELKTLIINESLDPGLNQKLKKTKFNQKNLSMSEIKTTEWFSDALKKIKNKTQFINKWLQLQDSVNCFLDATKSSKVADRDFKGIRQILEKKQGLFRMKMMGKRVNYAARSVISPDPSLQTDQVGLPVFMAKKLSFPQSVNQYNSERLKQYIVNGNQYPGASYIQQNGRLIKLDVLSEQQRISHARNLLVNAQNKVVYRHIMTGDNVLFNRQPTLHKPGLMAHRVRVLPKEQTLRMNYANCKSYNADFDGDQMNLHALQNYPAKAQAELCITDRIYTNPTNGKPIRQLIQDSIISAVYLTLKDTFLTKSEYSELLYQSTFSLFAKKPKNCRIFILPPTIIKPKQLWTGKQLISNIMKLIVSLSDHKFKNQKGLVMSVKSKMSVNYLKPGAEDEVNILVVDNQLLRGILVKDQIGSNSDYGLIHSFNELYGYQLTGQFLTCLTKLFTCYLQMHGFTCGLDDLILKKQVQTNRRNLINHAHNFTVQSIGKFLGLNQIPQNIDYVERSLYECDQQGNYKKNKKQQHYLTQNDEIVKRLAKKMQQPNGIAQVDGEYKELLFKKSSTVNNECLNGFLKRFPHNNFSMMTVTGAKGSNVNHSQVSSLLGQQQLQGKRVPMMINGKTLPCFLPYDPNPRAYGYISDRFFSGLRYQQFYFHCMAGRQGLIDTAVKTSRSGYLQRCLMKHLQSLKIQYDMTVRDADAGIIEFLYGEDSIDITKEKFLSKFQFLNKNKNPFTLKYQHNFFKDKLNLQEIRQFKSDVISQKQTIMNRFPVGKNIASISQKAYQSLKKYSKNLPINQQRHFQELYHLKYLNTLAHPGQSVGCTAAQAIGQPSTQLTLNTFHLAGHGGANLTLGIPRLRQILMTSTDKLKTPIMELYFSNGVTKQQANFYAKQLQKIKLIQLIKQIQVEEYKKLFEDEKILAPDDRKRIYNIKISYEDLRLIKQQFGITIQQIQQKINNVFIPLLLNHISRVLKKNQMKTQIKRTNVKNQKQEQLQDRDDSDIQQNEETKNKELKKQENQEEDINRYDSPFFDSKLFEEDHCKIKVKVPLNLKKFLMTKVIERLLKNVILRQIKDINNAVVLLKDNDDIKTIYIQTQGVNFKAISTLQFINKNSIYSNDIQAIYRTFGIEAARKSIIKQIVSVFGAYGVGVDYRHLYLIADYMTFPGAIKAMNRNWINENVSPFLKMSFETSVNFLTSAASFRQVDRCTTPSSQIVLGLNPTIGTGVFDLLMDLKFRK